MLSGRLLFFLAYLGSRLSTASAFVNVFSHGGFYGHKISQKYSEEIEDDKLFSFRNKHVNSKERLMKWEDHNSFVVPSGSSTLIKPYREKEVPRFSNLVAGCVEDHWRGTRTHINNALIGFFLPIYLISRQVSKGSLQTKVIMNLGFIAIIIDNLINASGKYVGEGKLLRQLSKIRFACHGSMIPLLFMPTFEIGMVSGIFSTEFTKVITAAAVTIAAYEMIEWFMFDIDDMSMVDNRHATEHSVRALAGTLSYTSGKLWKNILPCVILNLFNLGVASFLWWKNGISSEAAWLLAASIVPFVSHSVQRPDVQLYSEPVMMGLVWKAASFSTCL